MKRTSKYRRIVGTLPLVRHNDEPGMPHATSADAFDDRGSVNRVCLEDDQVKAGVVARRTIPGTN